MPKVCELAPDLCVHSLVGEASSHVVVRRGRSMLVDCHSTQFARWLDRHGLPHPELILHTHVEPRTCREADGFPGARIFVHEQAVELASDRAGYALAIDKGDFDRGLALCREAIALGLGPAYEAKRASIERMM